MKKFSALFGMLLATCLSAATAREAAPTATVSGGEIRGALQNGQGVFLGVPYVAPPVGELRWREPQPVKPWTGTRAATDFGPSCLQDFDFGPTSEDCLTLNIWAPEWPSRGAKPVMVWFHGGGDSSGGTNTLFFYGDHLAKQGVVVVSVNYRLGPLGFVALPELTAESPHKASGNYGLMDQIASLKWVRDNIAAFGGDPQRVTIFGQSAGAADVQRLMISPLSKGLFQPAIAESGALRRNDPTLAQMEKECTAALSGLRLPADNRLAALRRMSGADIINAFSRAQGCRPINLDGYVLPEQGFKVWAEGRQHAVPMIGGNVARESFDEMSFDELKQNIRLKYGEAAPRAYELYGLTGTRDPAPHPIYGYAYQQWGADHNNRCRVTWQALQHTAIGTPFYQYEFQRNLPGQSPTSNMHSNEVPSVFGIVFHPRYAPRFSEVDRKTADQMQRYWANFARTGDPNGPGLPVWPKADASRSFMAFGTNGAAPGQGLRRAYCDLFLEVEKAKPTASNPERSARW
jgi:para-nitrobenzyl esterase